MAKKVTFIVAAEIVAGATNGLLLGEFNNWNEASGFSLKKAKDGSLQTTVLLEEGKTYQYRYLLNDGRWVNDGAATNYLPDAVFQVENCVITVPAATKTKTKKTTVSAPAKPEKKTEKQAKDTVTTEAGTAFDDLTKVEGVGKKIAALLIAENITSFTALAKTSAKQLKLILDAAGNKFKMHDPATWPKQAKLAAANKWDDLKILQKELKGGK